MQIILHLGRVCGSKVVLQDEGARMKSQVELLLCRVIVAAAVAAAAAVIEVV